MKPLVSIIIPTYNRESLILRSLKSALCQTYENIEIIIVDDGSIDNTKRVVEGFIIENKLENVNYYYFVNEGVSSARNKGIQLAKGKYVAFLDSDDLWSETKLEKQLEQLIKSGYEVCYCGTKVIGKKEYKLPNSFRSGRILKDLIRAKVDAQTITWVISRKFLLENEIWFDENCDFAEDLEFLLKCCSLGRCCVVKEYLAFYCVQEESLSNNLVNRFKEVDMWDRYKAWCKIDIEKRSPENASKYIDKYRLPSIIVVTIFKMVRCNEKEEASNMYRVYKNYLKEFNPFYGRYALRYICYLTYIRVSIRKLENRCI